jgi:preprotein translocase subunit SecF
MAYRRQAVAISVLTTLIALGSLTWQGLNFGLDFTGGTVLEAQFKHDADLQRIRAAVTAAGFPEAQVQSIGGPTSVLVRLPPSLEDRNANEIVTRELRGIDPSLQLLPR